MVRDRLFLLAGTCSLLLAAPLGCDVDPANNGTGLNLPPSSGDDGGTGDTGGADDGAVGDGLPDSGADNLPDSGADSLPDTGGDDVDPDTGVMDGPVSTDGAETGVAETGATEDTGTPAETGATESTDGGTPTDGGAEGGAAGDCCEANGTPSCDDQACADATCALDSFCCDTQWDQTCVDVAASTSECECAPIGGSEGGGTGDCCEPHESTGCEDQACEDAICDLDPFCCDDQWDDVCTDAAFEDGACDCEGPGTTTGAPVDMDLLINEVLYDHPGVDADVFIEIAGEPGSSVTGVTIEAVNGNGGGVYDTLVLNGTIGASGLYLIVDPAANAALQALADEVDGIADLQNGPDSVRILVEGVEVDALGYGEFDSEVFAGEGSPATGVNDGMSLSRDGDTDDNSADFAAAVASPGAAN